MCTFSYFKHPSFAPYIRAHTYTVKEAESGSMKDIFNFAHTCPWSHRRAYMIRVICNTITTTVLLSGKDVVSTLHFISLHVYLYINDNKTFVYIAAKLIVPASRQTIRIVLSLSYTSLTIDNTTKSPTTF